MELALAFLGIPKVVWVILLVFILGYGHIRGAMALAEAYQRSYRRRKVLPDWQAGLKTARTVRLQVEDDNAIILESVAVGGFIIRHVYVNSSGVTVTYKSDALGGTLAAAEQVFARWVAEGLSPEGRVDGYRQHTSTYVEPKNKRNKKR